MNRFTLSLIGALLIIAVGVWVMWPRASAPALAEDLYPLYSSAQWSAAAPETRGLPLSTVAGVGIHSVPVTNTMNPASVFSPFLAYYREKLLAAGWSVDNMLEAGGPMGGQTAYRKDGTLILVTFDVAFHVRSANAPSECPCDVSLSLFSSAQ